MGAAGAAAWTVPSILTIAAASAQSGAGLMANYAQASNSTIAAYLASGGADLTFAINGPLSGIAHTPGTASFTVSVSGEYVVSAMVNTTDGAGAMIQPAVNAVVTGQGVTFVVSAGMVVCENLVSLAAGDIVTLRNNSSSDLIVAEAILIIVQIA